MQRIERRKLGAFLLVIFVCVKASTVEAQPPAMPQTVLSAHTLYIENQTTFSELEYTAILELNKWGHFQLTDRDKADLVLVLTSGTHVHAIPDGQYPRTTGLNAFTEESVPVGHTRIALLDPKTNTTLWSDVHRTEGGKVKNGHLLDELRQAYQDAEKARNKQ
jgi:hypothetical protein